MAPEMPAIKWFERRSELFLNICLFLAASVLILSIFVLKGKPVAKAILFSWIVLP